MANRDTLPLTLEDLDGQALAVRLRRSPSAGGSHGQAAVMLLVTMADGTMLDSEFFRRCFTVDRGQVFIDWAAVAQFGRNLLSDRVHIGPSSPNHPDAGYAMVLAAALATRQLTDSGISTLHQAIANIDISGE